MTTDPIQPLDYKSLRDATRLFCRLSAPEVRRQLIARKGYADERLPSLQAITTKLNALGFRLKKVAKSRPKKS